MKHSANVKIVVVFFFMTSLMAGGCTVRYVPDYDASIKEEIVQTAKKVDLFWGALLEMDSTERAYDKFKDQYNEIETDLRGLVMKNEIRALNEESAKQAQIALDLWIEDKKLHKRNDRFSDFEAERHRKQYIRLFTAMAKGEEAKNISTVGSAANPEGANE